MTSPTPSAQAVEQLHAAIGVSHRKFVIEAADSLITMDKPNRDYVLACLAVHEDAIIAAVIRMLEQTGKDIIGPDDPTEPGTTWGGNHTRNKLRGEQRQALQDFITELRGQTK